MFELNQLEQLIAIEEYGTISAAAEHLLISQPALSRSVQRLEDEIGVKLFDRQKNKLTMNEDGKMAVEYARRIIDMSNEMKTSIISANKARRTISIGSIAPVPMWNVTPVISQMNPEMSIQAEMSDIVSLERGLINDEYQLIITNNPEHEDNIICEDYCEEDLYISLPPAHPLASRKDLALDDLNGINILQYSDVGFWIDICKAHMPDSQFIMQDDRNTFDILRESSALPTFASNFTNQSHLNDHRVLIPLTDNEVNVIFYIKYKKINASLFAGIPPLI